MVRFKPIKIIRWLVLFGGLSISLNFLLESGQTSERNKLISNQDQFAREVRDKKWLPEDPELSKHEHNDNQNKKNEKKFIKRESNMERSNNIIQGNVEINNLNSGAYLNKLTSQRIERLFKVLLDKEKDFAELMNHLGLIMFENLINGKQDSAFKGYEKDRDLFLKVSDNRVKVTTSFMNYLSNLSEFYSFKHPRTLIKKYTFKGVSISCNFKEIIFLK